MFKINWQKVDKFYVIFISVLIILSGLTIYTLSTIFSSLTNALEVTQVQSNSVKINKENLDSAYNFATQKPSVTLNIK